MLEIFKKSFYILKNNLIFIQPLLLGLLLLMTAFTFLVGRNIFSIPKIVLMLSIVLMFIAFSAGWFYINKYGILNYNEDDSKEEIAVKAVQNFKKFFEGVGADFLKTALVYFITFLLYVALMFVITKFCINVFGEPKILYDFPKIAKATSQAEIYNYINSITFEDKITFVNWMIIVNFAASIMNFFIILYFAVMSFEEINILKCFWTAIKFFFKNILGVVAIIIFTFILYVCLNMLSVILGTNSLSLVILIILFTIYLNYYLLLVFCFYYDKTKNNSNNRTECIGEN